MSGSYFPFLGALVLHSAMQAPVQLSKHKAYKADASLNATNTHLCSSKSHCLVGAAQHRNALPVSLQHNNLRMVSQSNSECHQVTLVQTLITEAASYGPAGRPYSSATQLLEAMCANLSQGTILMEVASACAVRCSQSRLDKAAVSLPPAKDCCVSCTCLTRGTFYREMVDLDRRVVASARDWLVMSASKVGIQVAPDAAAKAAEQTEMIHIRLKQRPQSLHFCLRVCAWNTGCQGDFASTTCSLFRHRAQPLSLKACTCSRVLKANLSAGRRCQTNAPGAHPEAIKAQWAVSDRPSQSRLIGHQLMKEGKPASCSPCAVGLSSLTTHVSLCSLLLGQGDDSENFLHDNNRYSTHHSCARTIANINNCLLGHIGMPSWWTYKTEHQREKERNRPSRHQRLGIPKPPPRRALQPTGHTGSVAPQTPPKAPPRKRPCAAEHRESTQQGAYYQDEGATSRPCASSSRDGNASSPAVAPKLPPTPPLAPIRKPWLPGKQWIGNNPQRAMYWRREPGPAQSQPSAVPCVAQVIAVESDSSDTYSDSSDSGWCTPPRPAVAPEGTLICFEADHDMTADHADLLTVGFHGDWFTWVQVTSHSKNRRPMLGRCLQP